MAKKPLPINVKFLSQCQPARLTNGLLIISFIVFIVSIGQIARNLFLAFSHMPALDFSVYYGAAGEFLKGTNPYAVLYGPMGHYIPFNYPPSALPILSVLRIVPFSVAELIFTLLSFLGLWVSIILTIRLSKIKLPVWHILFILAFVNQTFPVKFTLVLGQVNMIVLGLTIIGIYLYKTTGGTGGGGPDSAQSGEHWRGGEPWQNLSFWLILICLSVASSLKLFPLYLLPLFVIAGDWVFAAGVGVLFTIFNVLPGLGKLAQEYYIQIVPNLSKSINVQTVYDQSITALLVRWGIEKEWVVYLSGILICILYGLILFLFYRMRLFARYNNLNLIRNNKKRHYSEVCCEESISIFRYSTFVLALFSIGNVFSWQHHLVFAYPMIILFYLDLLKKKKKLRMWFYVIVLGIWGILAMHLSGAQLSKLNIPVIASYQTILILVILVMSLSGKMFTCFIRNTNGR